MELYLIGAILITFSEATGGFPIKEAVEYYQHAKPDETLDDIIKNGHDIGAVLPESATLSMSDSDAIYKLIKEFIGKESDVTRKIFLCKGGVCKILNSEQDLNINKSGEILKAQKNKIETSSRESRFKEMREENENDWLSIEATHERVNKKEDGKSNSGIKSAPRFKLQHGYHGNRYVKLRLNTDPFDVSLTTPALPKLMKFHFAKTRVPQVTLGTPEVAENKKELIPDTLDQLIKQYQMYPGAGCVYEKGCNGEPLKIVKSPQAMKLLAKVFRELPEETDPGSHQVITFYLQKYQPQEIYFESEEFIPSSRATTTTTTISYLECFTV